MNVKQSWDNEFIYPINLKKCPRAVLHAIPLKTHHNMITLQILGVNGHLPTTSLVDNTANAIQQLGIIAKLERIDDIDEFVKYDLEDIPALIVNGKLVFQQMIPDVNDLATVISTTIARQQA